MSVSYGKNGNYDACKIETLEQIDTQFVRIDYIHDKNICSKFGKKSVHGGLVGKVVKYNFVCDFFFIYLFFLGPT